jgi:hypothetical protein
MFSRLMLMFKLLLTGTRAPSGPTFARGPESSRGRPSSMARPCFNASHAKARTRDPDTGAAPVEGGVVVFVAGASTKENEDEDSNDGNDVNDGSDGRDGAGTGPD